MLAIPNVLIGTTARERFGEAFSTGTVVVLAIDRRDSGRQGRSSPGILPRQERLLRLSELKFQSLFDNAGQAIIVLTVGHHPRGERSSGTCPGQAW